jgi:hypothetical protein
MNGQSGACIIMKNRHRLSALVAIGGAAVLGSAIAFSIAAPEARANDWAAVGGGQGETYEGLRILKVLEKKGYVALTTVTPGTDTFSIVFYVGEDGRPVPARYKIKGPAPKSAKSDANTAIRIMNDSTALEGGWDSRPGCPAPVLESDWEMMTVDEVEVRSDRIEVGYESLVPKVKVGLGMDHCEGIGTETHENVVGGRQRGRESILFSPEQLKESASHKVTLVNTKAPRRAGEFAHTEITLEPYSARN